MPGVKLAKKERGAHSHTTFYLSIKAKLILGQIYIH